MLRFAGAGSPGAALLDLLLLGLFSPQGQQLIPQLCGLLKLQLLRGGEHLAFDLGHQSGALVLIHGGGSGFLHLLRDLQHLPDAVAHALWGDAVGLVVGLLQGTAALGLADSPEHAVGDGVSIHQHPAVHIAGCAADGLHQRGLRAQEAFFVGVQDGHQLHLGQVQTFPQQVDAHQHIELTQPQLPQQLHAVDGQDV